MTYPQLAFDAIGTSFVVDLYLDAGSIDKAKLLSEVLSFIDNYDKTFSRFRKDSLIFKISQKKGEYILPENARKLFDLYYELYKLSNGLFTPLVGDLLRSAGYDESYSLTPRKIKKVLDWGNAIEYSYPKLKIKKPTMIDLGAAGKGYLIDLIGQFLEEKNINSYCIDGGGDILYKNSLTLDVGLENPNDTSQVIGVTKIVNESICGSSINRRSWDKYNHIMNPHTHNSVKNVIAVWVIADSALIADALSTCLFFVKPEVLASKYRFKYLKMYDNSTIDVSKDFPGDIFYNNGRVT